MNFVGNVSIPSLTS